MYAQEVTSPSQPTGELNEEEYAKDATTEINVKNADIAAIIRIFSRKTKRNYILDERVKGKISIYLPGKVSADESIKILDSVLAYKGFAAVPIGENLWKIVPAKEAKQSTIPTIIDHEPHEPTHSIVTRLVQLQYVSSDEVRQLISQLISPDGFITAYTGTNSLVIIDAEDNIARLLDIIKTIDVPFTDREMTIIPIQFADAVDIATKLNEILGEGSAQAASTESAIDLLRARVREAAVGVSRTAAANVAATGNATTPGTQAPSGTGTGAMVQSRSKAPKITADERTNSIIVVADEDTTARIRALITQLDTKLDLSGNRFYVYRCQHAKADELAEVLSGLSGSVGGSGRSTTGTGDAGTDLISGGRGMGSRNRTSQSGTQDRLRTQQRIPGRSRSESQPQRNGVKSATIGNDISITADPATNSLIIVASKQDFLKIKELLQELDIKRRQVIVEATLLEVGLDDNRSMGSSFIASTGGADGAILAQSNGSNIVNLLSDPAGIQDFSVAVASAGTLTIGGGDTQFTIPTQTLLLNAARANSNINILSAPTILTTDNEQAEIVVGQNVPFLASTATNDQNLNNTFNQIDRQDVGITLRLTPQISSVDIVTLKIFTEVSSVTSTDPRLGPTTSVRTSETSVITKDGQMVILGGLISDDINEAEAGVPYLKEVPVLGHLFRTTIERRRRTNLLILITPHVVKDQYDARDFTINRRDALKDEIRTQEMYPDRREVLDNLNIDRVSESTPFEGEAPTTIRPPTSDAPEAKTSVQQPADSSVLELRVNPKLPSREANTDDDAPAEKFLPSSTSTSDSFIVLQAPRNVSTKNDLPFTVSSKERLVGIVLPPEVGSAARSFFSAGGQFRYGDAKNGLTLSSVGVFSSAQEAAQLFPEVGTEWHTLSPYEIMNLGEGPWIRIPR